MPNPPAAISDEALRQLDEYEQILYEALIPYIPVDEKDIYSLEKSIRKFVLPNDVKKVYKFYNEIKLLKSRFMQLSS